MVIYRKGKIEILNQSNIYLHIFDKHEGRKNKGTGVDILALPFDII